MYLRWKSVGDRNKTLKTLYGEYEVKENGYVKVDFKDYKNLLAMNFNNKNIGFEELNPEDYNAMLDDLTKNDLYSILLEKNKLKVFRLASKIALLNALPKNRTNENAKEKKKSDIEEMVFEQYELISKTGLEEIRKSVTSWDSLRKEVGNILVGSANSDVQKQQ